LTGFRFLRTVTPPHLSSETYVAVKDKSSNGNIGLMNATDSSELCPSVPRRFLHFNFVIVTSMEIQSNFYTFNEHMVTSIREMVFNTKIYGQEEEVRLSQFVLVATAI